MKTWFIQGRRVGPVPHDWRAQLAERLGERPRRLGAWVELALFGALECLDAAGEKALDDSVLLSVSSVHGPDIALRKSLDEAREGPPLPIGFLNSQPGQVLPALARYLRWRGDGRCLTTRHEHTALWLAGLRAGPGGLLLGWVDEDTPGRSDWLRLLPAVPSSPAKAAPFKALSIPSVTLVSADADALYIHHDENTQDE